MAVSLRRQPGSHSHVREAVAALQGRIFIHKIVDLTPQSLKEVLCVCNVVRVTADVAAHDSPSGFLGRKCVYDVFEG